MTFRLLYPGLQQLINLRGFRELLKLLRLLRDPENQVLLIAVLRGIFYGFSDDELYQFKRIRGSI